MVKVSAEKLSREIIEKLQGAGHVAYWAGGCVRDRLMGRVPKDFDVATSAVPEEVLKLFPRSQKVGVAFGVVLVKERGGGQVEVATFRADGDYSDGRHPDSVRFTNAQEDAKRRDFTCNGLFFDPVAETLHDFVGGQKDIEGKILRAIGDAGARFGEDHLRMLRAVRFAARLGFGIESQTRGAMEKLQGKIATISRERIGEELRMMLEHPTRLAAMELLSGFGEMFAEVFGFGPPAGAAEREWPVLGGLPEKAGRAVGLLAILLDAGVSDLKGAIGELRRRLMLSNEETEGMGWVAEKLAAVEDWEDLSKAAMKRLMANGYWGMLEMVFRADPANAEEMFAFAERVEAMREEGVAPAPFVTGETLQKLGAKPGPRFKGWLEEIYDRQLNGEIGSEAEGVEAARRLVKGS